VSNKWQPLKANPIAYILRALFVTLAQYCLLNLLSQGSILLAILLFSTNGIFLPFLEKLVFNRPIKLKTFITIIMGLIGTAIIIGPLTNVTPTNLIIGLLSGFFSACAQLPFHYLSKKQGATTTSLLTYGLCSLFSLPLALLLTPDLKQSYHELATTRSFAIVLLFSILSISTQTSRSLAYKKVNRAATLMPFIYSSLVFSAMIDWLW
jgi:drug/metabolite transporter (DMT)-like permease